MRTLRSLSTAVKLTAIAVIGILGAAGGTALLSRWLSPWVAAASSAVFVGCLVGITIRRVLAPTRALFRALAGTVASYRDGDFSFGIRWNGAADIGELVASHNALGDALREQRLALVQRELLLDTMVQNTPVAMILVDPNQRVVLGNLAARRMLGKGRRLEGRAFGSLLDDAEPAVREAFERGGDGMFTVGREDDEDIFHLSRRSFRLNGRLHELLLLRQLTAELRRQEVQTWKRSSASSATSSTTRWHRLLRWRIPAPNCCAAASMSACPKHWPPSKNAPAIWKVSSATTHVSPSCPHRVPPQWSGRASSRNCKRRSNASLMCTLPMAWRISMLHSWSRP